jgi:hypothetical protein
MRGVAAIVLAIAVAVPCWAQRGGMRGGFGGVGIARGTFHGGVPWRGAPVFRGGFRGGARFRGSSRGFRNFYRHSGYGYGFGFGAAYWPVFYGGFGYYGGLGYYDNFGYFDNPWYTPYTPPPVYLYSVPPPASAAPVVVINETPSVPVYQEPPRYIERRTLPEPSREEPYRPAKYRLEFKDKHSVIALAYWIKDGTLHYVTPEFVMKSVPASSVTARYREVPDSAR